jgi:hypothetical protein
VRMTLSRALYLLGIATAAYTTVPQYRYGHWLDPAAFLVIGGFAVPYGTAALMVFLHWAKVVLVAAIVSLWRCKHRTAAVVVGAICFGLAALSLWNSMALLTLSRSERLTTSDAVAQRDADLRAEIRAIAERLALVGWRPLATVTAEIAAERRQYAWESTSGCTQIKTGVDRRYCARIDRLDGERLVALDAEQLRFRQAEVRRALEQQPVATKGRQPDLALFADVFGMSPDHAELLRALVYSMLVETVELALFWVASLLSLGWTSARWDEREGGASLSPAARDMSVKRVHDGHQQPGAGADILQATSDEASTDAISATDKKYTCRRPPIINLFGSCEASPRALEASSRAASVTPVDERRRAVTAFVAQLPRSVSARASGSALYAAYDHLRGGGGWPPIPPNVFGALLKPAIEAVGGRKIKSNCQTYIGVGAPPL